MAALRAEGLAFRLIFAGAWPEPARRPAFERRLAALGLGGVARVTGAVSRAEAKGLLLASDALALPSVYPSESSPLVVLEAMAAGCAVVAARHAGLGELFRDGVEGRLVAPGDGAALAAALREVLGAPEAFGRRARARYEAAFAPEVVAGAYRAALFGPRPGGGYLGAPPPEAL